VVFARIDDVSIALVLHEDIIQLVAV
jgi:hypothetical protein